MTRAVGGGRASSEIDSYLGVLTIVIYSFSLAYEVRLFHGLKILREIFLYTYSCLRGFFSLIKESTMLFLRCIVQVQRMIC